MLDPLKHLVNPKYYKLWWLILLKKMVANCHSKYGDFFAQSSKFNLFVELVLLKRYISKQKKDKELKDKRNRGVEKFS